MRSKSWVSSLDREYTITAYVNAYRDGAHALAQRIEIANSGENLQADWQPIDFIALRNGVDTLS